jgi:hypothetical protein
LQALRNPEAHQFARFVVDVRHVRLYWFTVVKASQKLAFQFVGFALVYDSFNKLWIHKPT